jgi:hypothetical protein
MIITFYCLLLSANLLDFYKNYLQFQNEIIHYSARTGIPEAYKSKSNIGVARILTLC